MKKKNLKYLRLQKYSVSNLTLLDRKTGGALVTNTDGQAVTIPTDQTVCNADCVHVNNNTYMISDCVGTLCGQQCHTNAGTTRAQPPSEHQGCNVNTNTNPNAASIHMG